MREIQRRKGVAIPLVIIYGLLVAAFWYISHYPILQVLVAAVLLAPVFVIGYLVFSYNGPKNSKLYGLEYLTSKLPAVKKAKGHVKFKYKLMWTALVVILYFALTNVYVYGLNASQTIDVFASIRNTRYDPKKSWRTTIDSARKWPNPGATALRLDTRLASGTMYPNA